ncbi:Caprin-1 Cell cycle-associated protein 1 [Triplophysa tibetana]|uniref:Caprin-1 Cell cycle-associated protein 1 n=1 Tax=Triplophysa tibetana TaxID=1572043 RepID=A0A5A9NZ25_9TELE|nr:Caprin-1 Cell cycle-associated protein 1 [Triplophysa tibetana]
MPSATNGTRTMKSASPELGSAPASMNQNTAINQSEAMKQLLVVLEKKVRNMEKKKGKLDDYNARNIKGESLNQDQLEALTKYQEVNHNLEFARELHKSFLALGQEIQKAVKKTARREQLLREDLEQKRLKRVLELQFLLDRLGDESVRQELLQGAGGPPVLTEVDLTALDEYYKLVGPERDQNIRLTDQYKGASQHLWDLLEVKDKPVAGTTYKALNETLERVLQSGYFDRVQSYQNGVCAEEEAQTTAVEVPEVEEHPADTEGVIPEEYTEPIPFEPTEFVNRQLISETTYTSGDKELVEEWSAETQVVNSMQQLVQAAPTPVVPEPHPLTTVNPTPPSDPVVRKRVVQDLMAQMQGPYNFMQDSMLEFDGQALDPAIVLAQPMKPTVTSRLAQPPAVAIQSEHKQIPVVSPSPEAFSTQPSLYQSSHTADPQQQTDSLDSIRASMPMTEQPPPSTAAPPASQTQAFQSGSKPLHSGGINVNAAPFQSMQTVFNLNAPVPPANDTDSMKQTDPYENSYNQGFNSQTQPIMEEVDIPPEQLQSVVGAFHSQDQSLPNSTGHQPMSQQPSGQANGFSRQTQSFYNSRGMSRGGPRNSRGVMNGYRGPSNGFRGGYDGYRPPFSNSANSGYGQPQFSTPRDYPNSNYQRDGYQQNYKRGAVQGSRGAPRGNAPAMRS